MLPQLFPTATLSETETHQAHASAARSAAGHPAKKTDGSAPAGMNGTPSTREESVPPACTDGLKPSAFPVADGRRTRSGTCSSPLCPVSLNGYLGTGVDCA